jgi:hypothetical protein
MKKDEWYSVVAQNALVRNTTEEKTESPGRRPGDECTGRIPAQKELPGNEGMSISRIALIF